MVLRSKNKPYLKPKIEKAKKMGNLKISKRIYYFITKSSKKNFEKKMLKQCRYPKSRLHMLNNLLPVSQTSSCTASGSCQEVTTFGGE